MSLTVVTASGHAHTPEFCAVRPANRKGGGAGIFTQNYFFYSLTDIHHHHQPQFSGKPREICPIITCILIQIEIHLGLF